MPLCNLIKKLCLLVVFCGALAGGANYRLNPVSAADLHTHTLQADGMNRTYTVYIPSGYDNKKPVPVVVMLHGAGGTGEGVIQETGWDKKADQEGFLVVFPNALRINQEATASFLTNPQMWNDGSSRDRNLLPQADDVKFISLMLDSLEKSYAIDSKAIFITGFSNGASLAFRIANELPDRIAAIAPVSGHYWPLAASSTTTVMPTILIIGTADPLNPFDGGTIRLPWGSFEQPPFMDTIQGWAKRNGHTELRSADARPGVKALYPAAGKMDYRVYIVEGLGHMWPGGEAIFPENFIGKDPGTLQATEEIWRYFSEIYTRTARGK